jgi:hypothetical protein
MKVNHGIRLRQYYSINITFFDWKIIAKLSFSKNRPTSGGFRGRGGEVVHLGDISLKIKTRLSILTNLTRILDFEWSDECIDFIMMFFFVDTTQYLNDKMLRFLKIEVGFAGFGYSIGLFVFQRGQT